MNLKFRDFYPLVFFPTNLENTAITQYQQQKADPLRLNIKNAAKWHATIS